MLIICISCPLNLYSENVSLPLHHFSSGDGYVSVIGSWVADTEAGVIYAEPVQTSEITCTQATGVCIEARAVQNSMSGNLLAMNFEYKISKWTLQEVIAVHDARAGTIELRFDLVKKIVTYIETEKGEIPGAAKLPFYAHMDDGSVAMQKAQGR